MFSDLTARLLLDRVKALGYHVSVFQLGTSLLGSTGRIELHAISAEDDVHLVWAEDNEPDVEYVCACRLAESVGVDLEGKRRLPARPVQSRSGGGKPAVGDSTAGAPHLLSRRVRNPS